MLRVISIALRARGETMGVTPSLTCTPWDDSFRFRRGGGRPIWDRFWVANVCTFTWMEMKEGNCKGGDECLILRVVHYLSFSSSLLVRQHSWICWTCDLSSMTPTLISGRLRHRRGVKLCCFLAPEILSRRRRIFRDLRTKNSICDTYRQWHELISVIKQQVIGRGDGPVMPVRVRVLGMPVEVAILQASS